jgi:hypothetical protein
MIEWHRAAGGAHPPQWATKKGRTEVGGRPPSGKPRASDLGEDAQGKRDIQVQKIGSLSNESPSEQRSLLGVAEFNIKSNVIDGDCCCSEFAWLDSVVIQPCAHIAQE